jgi:hypothetical protein
MKVYIVVEDEELEEGGYACVIQDVFANKEDAEFHANALNIPYGGYSVSTFEVLDFSRGK